MKVLVTGHLGYIGVELARLLQEAGHTVIGCDLGLFLGSSWHAFSRPEFEIQKDIRALTVHDLVEIDAVMHLAALSNDPMGNLSQELTYDINLDATVHLAHIAKEAGVKKFLFASSCSVYGQGVQLDLDEKAHLSPLTPYAESKIRAEEEILKLANKFFQVVSLRSATAYGSSAMLRLDLVVNNFLACAYTKGEIQIMSDGSPWRPLIHARDIARAFLAFLDSDISGEAINIGANRENYQVRDVAELVKKLLPNSKIVYTGVVGKDPRNYRVNFDKLGLLLPGFKLQYTLLEGMEELLRDFRRYGMTINDFDSQKYIRLERLKKDEVYSLLHREYSLPRRS